MAAPQHVERLTETARDIAADVIALLKLAGETVGVAESLTGGGVMQTITTVSGASSVFRGGVVSYATPLKQGLLQVDAALISERGVIDGDVAKQMSIGARNITACESPTTWGIGTTGVAGPDSQDGKPVGMVYIGIASPDDAWGFGPFSFPGDRDQIRQSTITEALAQFRKKLRERTA